MAELKPGDAVVVVEREPTSDDTKSGLYYSHFGNLAGKVDRVYDDGTVCVDISVDALPDGIRRRHEATQNAAKARWLDSLSGEARGRLTELEKQFNLSYTILVSSKDVKSGKAAGPSKPGARAKQADAPTPSPPKPESKTSQESEATQRGAEAGSKATGVGPAVAEAKASRESGAARAEPEPRATKSAEAEPHRLTQEDLDKAERALLAEKMRGQARPARPRRTPGG